MKRVSFWYDFASTYSYLSAMRVENIADAAGVKVHWRPFLLGPIFKAQGLHTSPFNTNAAKGIYMLRDMQRLTRQQGIPFAWPQTADGSDGFPRASLLAARVALVGIEQRWVNRYTRAVFETEFGTGADISSSETISDILLQMELDPEVILNLADSPDIKQRLRSSTEEAVSKGIFGAPSFTVGDEVFWGDDRLQAAFDWATQRCPM